MLIALVAAVSSVLGRTRRLSLGFILPRSATLRAFVALAPLSVVWKTREQLGAVGQASWQEPAVLPHESAS